MKENTKVIMFDLDGTLVDSAKEIHFIINKMCLKYGLSPLNFDSVRRLAGFNAFKIVEVAFPNLKNKTKLVEEFREIYACTTTPKDSCFENVHECLEELKGIGLNLALITNKPENLRQKVLIDTSLADFFSYVQSPSESIRAKPAPDMLNKMLEDLKIGNKQAFFIGDSILDYQAANSAGIPFIGFGCGYDNEIINDKKITKFYNYRDLTTIIKSIF